MGGEDLGESEEKQTRWKSCDNALNSGAMTLRRQKICIYSNFDAGC